MRRLLLVSAAVLAILAAPVIVTAQPQQVTVTRWPSAPPAVPTGGTVAMFVMLFDGGAWRIIDGVNVAPQHSPTVCAPIVPGPAG